MSIGATFTAIPTGNTNRTSLSDTYTEISFPAGAGNLTAGTYLEMYLKIYKTDNSLFNELNDFSYIAPTKPVMTRWDHITAYRNGTLVWGIEPTASTILTSTPTRTPTLYVPTATYTKTATSSVPTATYTKTKTPTAASAAATATATKTPTSAATRTYTPLPPTATPSASLKVQAEKDPSGTDNNSSTGLYTLISNTGTAAASNVTMRIYFTTDGTYTASQYSLEDYYDTCTGSIQGPTLFSGTTYYYTFTCSASLAAGATWQAHFGFHLADWSTNYVSTNDWWHTSSALPTTYTDWTHLPAYINGNLSWGATP